MTIWIKKNSPGYFSFPVPFEPWRSREGRAEGKQKKVMKNRTSGAAQSSCTGSTAWTLQKAFARPRRDPVGTGADPLGGINP